MERGREVGSEQLLKICGAGQKVCFLAEITGALLESSVDGGVDNPLPLTIAGLDGLYRILSDISKDITEGLG